MRPIGLLARNAPIERMGLTALQMATLVVLTVFLFFSVMQGLVVDWWTHSEYSHGFLIPLLSGYLLWMRREELWRCPKHPSVTGLCLLVMGLALYVVGSTGEEEFFQRLSLPLTLIGLVYFLGGGPLARRCLFPIGYLLLMIPPPYTFYKAIALELRLLDANLVATWSAFLGVPVFQEGYLLHLPRIILEVADACSGVLSIVALFALGVFYIELLKIGRVKKALLWLTLIPFSVLANVVRILIITVLVHYSGDWILETTFHRFAGTVNFLLGFAAVVTTGTILRRVPVFNRGAR